MKVTFFSNFLNHHQLPFCQEMIKIIGNDFWFVATEIIPEERIKLGYEDMNSNYDFVVRAYENNNLAKKLAKESDVVIIGDSPNIYMNIAIKNKKLCFRYSERIYKNGFNLKKWLSFIKNITLKEYGKSYLLCASAYSSMDFSKSFAYINKAFKWGYFPNIKQYENINKILSKKENNSILWVGRFIDFKHPEIVVELGKKLKNENYRFNINMIGIGNLKEKIETMIKENGLGNNIKLLGSMSPDDVRKYMEKSKIFIFTSDRGEGWGAVLNEAMNSGCSVVASHKIGSVPFLIKNNENGLIYKDGDIDDLFKNVTYLLINKKICNEFGHNAYMTMINTWNPKVAAKRFVELSKSLLNNRRIDKYTDGPCSIAKRLNDDWYKG